MLHGAVMRLCFLALLSVLLVAATPRAGFSTPCGGAGVDETLAAVRTQCCPARNHGAYVSCAAHVTNRLVKQGKLQASCKHLVFKAGCPATTTTVPPATTTSTIIAPTTTTVAEATTSTSTSSTEPPPTSTSSSTTSTTHPGHKPTTTTMALLTTTTSVTSTTIGGGPTTTTIGGGPTTTTSTPPTTTSTTEVAPPSTTTTMIPGLPGPHEICGNCIDDDNNGLTDFEDPACCAGTQSFALTLRKGKLKPRGATTRLRLKTVLAPSGLQDVDPLKQDVFLQIRPEGARGDVLCAKVPAMKFMRMHGAFKFWDHKHTVASAKGIDDLTIKVRKDGSVRLRTVGRHVQFQTPAQGPLQVTVGFLHESGDTDAQNRCSTTVQAFRNGRQGRLLAP